MASEPAAALRLPGRPVPVPRRQVWLRAPPGAPPVSVRASAPVSSPDAGGPGGASSAAAPSPASPLAGWALHALPRSGRPAAPLARWPWSADIHREQMRSKPRLSRPAAGCRGSYSLVRTAAWPPRRAASISICSETGSGVVRNLKMLADVHALKANPQTATTMTRRISPDPFPSAGPDGPLPDRKIRPADAGRNRTVKHNHRPFHRNDNTMFAGPCRPRPVLPPAVRTCFAVRRKIAKSHDAGAAARRR